jgi:hypothetical protein
MVECFSKIEESGKHFCLLEQYFSILEQNYSKMEKNKKKSKGKKFYCGKIFFRYGKYGQGVEFSLLKKIYFFGCRNEQPHQFPARSSQQRERSEQQKKSQYHNHLTSSAISFPQPNHIDKNLDKHLSSSTTAKILIHQTIYTIHYREICIQHSRQRGVCCVPIDI